MANAINPGQPYLECVPFTTQDTEKHLTCYMMHGLALSPIVELKFKIHISDLVNANDFLNIFLGGNFIRRQNNFRLLFFFQDPSLTIPSWKFKPNHKLEYFLQWIIKVCTEAWQLGYKFSVDEKIIGFQGNHGDNLSIAYKSEGGGFQVYDLCNDGFTYVFYFRNEPVLNKYTI